MQVTAIYAGTLEYSNKLNYIFNIFNNTSNELGIKIETIDITKLNIEYFSGKKVTIIENIFNNIKNSSAVIFVCTAKLFSLCGAMQVFLEHFDQNIYPNILQNKPCYSIITSFDGSEFNAGNHLNTIINFLGGNSIGNMFVGSQYLVDIELSLETTKMIERYAEDFYRLLKQNRKLFQSKPFNFNNINPQKTNFEEANIYNNSNPSDFIPSNNITQSKQKVIKNLNGQQVSELYQKEVDNQNFNYYYDKKNLSVNEFSSKNFNSTNTNTNNDYTYQLQNFNNFQDDDISEITKLLTRQYNTQNNNQNNLDNFNVDTFPNQKISNGGTCKQRTKSLYHYFQPQIAKDMNIIIQVNINGEENFNGYFQIKNSECTYIEGETNSFDVAIISDSNVWEEVLNGKYTLQKAFMLGKVKVKGNFVIISKFEQLFKLN